VRVCAVLTAAAAMAVGGAPAQAGDGVPDTGFGSRSDPMTRHHGGIPYSMPLVRVFDPCAHFGFDLPGRTVTREIMARLKVTDLGELTLLWPHEGGPPQRARLVCGRANLKPFHSEVFDVDSACAQGERYVAGSTAFHHGAGPIVIATQRSGVLRTVNIGWVNADVDVWWLCA